MDPYNEMDRIRESLRREGYIADDNILVVIFLAFNLKKPILVEGPPGTGKT
ncbi:MAG: MoxR family ATPase, partial [Methanobacteriales archaeon]|nr:MoxR family ATPase [Methanobacteriales archaeon]